MHRDREYRRITHRTPKSKDFFRKPIQPLQQAVYTDLFCCAYYTYQILYSTLLYHRRIPASYWWLCVRRQAITRKMSHVVKSDTFVWKFNLILVPKLRLSIPCTRKYPDGDELAWCRSECHVTLSIIKIAGSTQWMPEIERVWWNE